MWPLSFLLDIVSIVILLVFHGHIVGHPKLPHISNKSFLNKESSVEVYHPNLRQCPFFKILHKSTSENKQIILGEKVLLLNTTAVKKYYDSLERFHQKVGYKIKTQLIFIRTEKIVRIVFIT